MEYILTLYHKSVNRYVKQKSFSKSHEFLDSILCKIIYTKCTKKIVLSENI